ncbi:unnamed protein product [[Candida] boidinii]|uniref:Unnamed protein product n=1 Tax=Candida boidinii TaxID=5477 RepID=A0A9W6WHH3_CANBO|nr:unnamed protein product [[Candida] boidinii]GMF53937.1 unnamed protein product [[Candida] boidinii]GMG01856.1 unnamed protein product [[Candida] boidinii]
MDACTLSSVVALGPRNKLDTGWSWTLATLIGHAVDRRPSTQRKWSWELRGPLLGLLSPPPSLPATPAMPAAQPTPQLMPCPDRLQSEIQILSSPSCQPLLPAGHQLTISGSDSLISKRIQDYEKT